MISKHPSIITGKWVITWRSLAWGGMSSGNALVVGGERERFWSSVLLQSRFRIRFITKSFWCCFQSVGVG